MLVGILVPVTFFFVTAIIWVTWIYFRSKEKQMMIEKGMSYEQMVEFLKSKRNPYTVLKIGIVTTVSGIGIGIGSYIGENYHDLGGISALFVIVFIGLGFIAAFYATKKYEIENNGSKEQ